MEEDKRPTKYASVLRAYRFKMLDTEYFICAFAYPHEAVPVTAMTYRGKTAGVEEEDGPFMTAYALFRGDGALGSPSEHTVGVRRQYSVSTLYDDYDTFDVPPLRLLAWALADWQLHALSGVLAVAYESRISVCDDIDRKVRAILDSHAVLREYMTEHPEADSLARAADNIRNANESAWMRTNVA